MVRNLLRISLFALAGCAGGLKEFPVAEVTGVVLCEGKPVPFAKVQFNPKAEEGAKSAEVGKPGFAFADKDGRFVLSTYGTGDGAVIGKHTVTAVPDPQHPCNCHSDDITPLMEVEVKDGQKNEFEVQVPLKKGNTQPTPDPFSDPE